MAEFRTKTPHRVLSFEAYQSASYWEWGLDVASPRDSPLFNGDEYSLGSDGAPEPHGQLPILVFYVDQDNTIQNTTLNVPPGTGGGCVFAGPFSNYTVNMGPLHSATGPPVNSTFAYNPRCLKRDLSPVTATNWTSFANYTPIQTDASDITKFQSLIDGDPRDPANVLNIGPHGGGHFSLSGGKQSVPLLRVTKKQDRVLAAPGGPPYHHYCHPRANTLNSSD